MNRAAPGNDDYPRGWEVAVLEKRPSVVYGGAAALLAVLFFFVLHLFVMSAAPRPPIAVESPLPARMAASSAPLPSVSPSDETAASPQEDAMPALQPWPSPSTVPTVREHAVKHRFSASRTASPSPLIAPYSSAPADVAENRPAATVEKVDAAPAAAPVPRATPTSVPRASATRAPLPVPTMSSPAVVSQEGPSDYARSVANPPRAAAPIDRPYEGVHAVVLGIARIEMKEDGYTVWGFLSNLTGQSYDVELASMQAANPAGEVYPPRAYHARGSTVTLKSGQILYLWPSFEYPAASAQNGTSGLEFRITLDGYGRLRAPLEAQMTNLGIFETLPVAVQERLTDDFKRNPSFKWWD